MEWWSVARALSFAGEIIAISLEDCSRVRLARSQHPDGFSCANSRSLAACGSASGHNLPRRHCRLLLTLYWELCDQLLGQTFFPERLCPDGRALDALGIHRQLVWKLETRIAQRTITSERVGCGECIAEDDVSCPSHFSISSGGDPCQRTWRGRHWRQGMIQGLRGSLSAARCSSIRSGSSSSILIRSFRAAPSTCSNSSS